MGAFMGAFMSTFCPLRGSKAAKLVHQVKIATIKAGIPIPIPIPRAIRSVIVRGEAGGSCSLSPVGCEFAVGGAVVDPGDTSSKVVVVPDSVWELLVVALPPTQVK